LPLTLLDTESIDVHVVGVGKFSVDNSDEGKELERLTFQAFDFLCPSGAFLGPQVGEGKKRRELCDVLAVSRVRECEEEGIFVIQNKVASASPEGLSRKTERRAKSIQKNILGAIGQLEGAIKVLRGGEPVYREDGSSIELAPPFPGPDFAPEPLNLRERASKVGHGLVVVSDMHGGVDWREVLVALAKAWISTGYYCQVLDLKELGRLVSHSRRRAAVLESLLIRRAEIMMKSGSACVRCEFLPGGGGPG
jgi:hypothetical protein